MTTKLEELMAEGWEVMTSPVVKPGHPFVGTDGAFGDGTPSVIVFHPFDYRYIAYEDIFTAHELNMADIYAKIDLMAEQAEDRLDKMVYEMAHKHDPRTVVFLYNTEAIENPDGSFTFYAQPKFESEKVREFSNALESLGATFVQSESVFREAAESMRSLGEALQTGVQPKWYQRLLGRVIDFFYSMKEVFR